MPTNMLYKTYIHKRWTLKMYEPKYKKEEIYVLGPFFVYLFDILIQLQSAHIQL